MTPTATPRAPLALLLAPVLFLFPAVGMELVWTSEDAARSAQVLQASVASDLQTTGLDLVLPAPDAARAASASQVSLEFHTTGLDLTFAPGGPTLPGAAAAPLDRTASLGPLSTGLDTWFTLADAQPSEASRPEPSPAASRRSDLHFETSGADLWFGCTYAPLPAPAPRPDTAALGPQVDPLTCGADLWFTPAPPATPARATLARSESPDWTDGF